MRTPSPPIDLPARVDALGRALVDGAPLWRTRPFRERRLPWELDWPALSTWCRAQEGERLHAAEQDPFAVQAPAPWGAWVERLRPLVDLDPLPLAPPPPVPGRRIPQRKAEQIGHFAAAVLAASPPEPAVVVEWCAGLGHLGRLLGDALDQRAWLVERDPLLCRDPDTDVGRGRAVHVHADAFDPALPARLPRGSLLVGLHACGSLTDRLLDVGVARDAALVAAAPCCLHRLVGADVYTPRSAAGRAVDPRLAHDDLRMATRDAGFAGARRTRLRANELLLRAAWDLACRDATGDDVHHPLPQVPRSTFDLDLEDFFAVMAARTGQPAPPGDPAALLARARARVQEIRALELPRLLFRRAIEVFVAADRAASLAEAGWQVQLGPFCPPSSTPRNLMIVAQPAR